MHFSLVYKRLECVAQLVQLNTGLRKKQDPLKNSFSCKVNFKISRIWKMYKQEENEEQEI